jgi:hypothetical protein
MCLCNAVVVSKSRMTILGQEYTRPNGMNAAGPLLAIEDGLLCTIDDSGLRSPLPGECAECYAHYVELKSFRFKKSSLNYED